MNDRGNPRRVRNRERLLWMAIALVMATIPAATNIVRAAIPDAATNQITGCYNDTGALRVIDRAVTPDCKAGERRVTWAASGGPAVYMWLNHTALRPGDSTMSTTFAGNSTVGGGLSALEITSSSTGGGVPPYKTVAMAVEVPPGFVVTGVRIAYQNSSAASYIRQVRLAQLQDPPSTALVLLDDGTALTSTAATYADTTTTVINPTSGALYLTLFVTFAATTDKIAIRGIGLRLLPE